MYQNVQRDGRVTSGDKRRDQRAQFCDNEAQDWGDRRHHTSVKAALSLAACKALG
jgi:hypothetical protein